MPYFAPDSLPAFLAQVPDPRRKSGLRHPLVAMLTAACCAILCGAKGYAGIAQWARTQPIEWMHRIGFKRRPPCEGAYQRLFSALDASALEAVLATWTERLLERSPNAKAKSPNELRPVSIDGKVLRGSGGPLRGTIDLLSVFDQIDGFVLLQSDVGSTNEHKAALKLLENLVLKGRVVTGDAMFCPRDLSRNVVEAGGDYLFKIDDHQPTLKADVALAFEPSFSPLSPRRT